MAVVPLEHPTTSEDIHSDVAASSCLCWNAAVVNKVVCNTDQGSNITAAPVLYQCSDCQDHISNTVLRRASHPAHFRGLTLCSSLWIQFTFLWKCFMFRHISVDIFRGLSRMSFANWTRTKLFHKANSEIMWQKLLVHDQMIHLVFSNASHGLPQLTDGLCCQMWMSTDSWWMTFDLFTVEAGSCFWSGVHRQLVLCVSVHPFPELWRVMSLSSRGRELVLVLSEGVEWFVVSADSARCSRQSRCWVSSVGPDLKS